MSSPELRAMQSVAAEPPRGFRRFFALVAAVLVVAMLVGSSMWLFSALRTLPQHTTTAQSDTADIHTGKLLCHTSYTSQLDLILEQPPLSWSAQGMIALVNPTLKFFSAKTCEPVASSINAYPVWSPDGKRILELRGSTATVLDADTGSVLASFKADPSYGFDHAVWLPKGTQIITSEVDVLTHTTQSAKIQVWDASSGTFIRTVFTFSSVLIGGDWISPNGQFLAVQQPDHKITFWDSGTGMLVSTTTSSVAAGGPVAWAPDSAALAIGISGVAWPAQPGEVQIWSSTTGHLQAAFQDADTFEGMIGGLAWSLNGRYLAESSAEIHVWNVSTGKLVATFGKITMRTTSSNGQATVFREIDSVAWAPDSRALASTTTTFPTLAQSKLQKTLDVWQLS